MTDAAAPLAVPVLVLRSSEWLRDEGPDCSRLLRPKDGKRCCQGIWCRDLGMPDAVLMDREDTLRLSLGFLPIEAEWAHQSTPGAGPEVTAIVDANDDPRMTDAQRIAAMAPVWARHGVTIDFRPEE